MTQNPRHIVISDEKHALPYSKGLMASSIMATGLPPARAFHVAVPIEERLRDPGARVITGCGERAAVGAGGAQALVRRAVAENTDLILEGARLVPGFMDPAEFT